MNNKEVEDCTIFLTVAGSRAYGTNTPVSDWDYRGVCVPRNASYYVGMGLKRFEQKDSGWSEDDRVVYDLRKILSLCADGNPNCIDLLYTDEKHWISCSPSWKRVLEIRELFLSKKMRFTYGGYAFAQLKRIKRHRNYLLNPPKNKPERVDFGLPERKLVSSENMGAFQWLLAKVLQDGIEVMKISPELREELYGINYIGSVQSGIPEECAQEVKEFTGASDEFVDLIMREKRYENAMKGWKAYHKWKEERNDKRQELEALHGYDTKHAMHLVRLMRMGMEILEEGKVQVYRPDREELLAIRNGAWTYEQVEQFAEDSDKKLDELYKISSLPKQPNRNKIDQVCCEIIEELVFSPREKVAISNNVVSNNSCLTVNVGEKNG